MNDNMINIPWPDWELVEQIGQGQFGSVYKISSTKYGVTEFAAMKVITIPNDPLAINNDYNYGYDKNSVAAKYKSYLDEVLKEYQLMMKIKGSPNIVRCDDISVSAHEDGIGWDVYIRMEFLIPILNTPVFKNLSRENNEIVVIKLGKDLCGALIACENENILHRDIKPSNILLSKQGGYKLGDFGVSRTLESENTFGTKGIGTYDYMAPEIYNGGKYGKEADIYSLGMVMYWMLNGKTFPFLVQGRAPTAQELTSARQRRFSGQALPRPVFGSDALVSIVYKACAFDVNNRYRTAREMLNDLNSISSGASSSTVVNEMHLNQESVQPKVQQVTQQDIQTPIRQPVQQNTALTWNDTQETVGKNYSSNVNSSDYAATVGRQYNSPNQGAVSNAKSTTSVMPKSAPKPFAQGAVVNPTGKRIKSSTNSSCIIGFVFSIIAVLFLCVFSFMYGFVLPNFSENDSVSPSLFPVITLIGFIFVLLFSVLGLIFSNVGLKNVKIYGERGKGIAIAGIPISWVSLAFALLNGFLSVLLLLEQ